MKLRLLALSLLMVGCHNSVQEKKLNWSVDSATLAPRLEEIKGLSHDQGIKLSSHKIDFYDQQIDGLKVDESVVKVLSHNEGEPLVVNGIYYENLQMDQSEIAKAKLNRSESYPLLVKSHPELKKMRLLDQEVVLSKSGRRIIPVYSFTTEDHLGQIWNIRSKEKGLFVSMKVMGSNFENIDAMVFPRGPKQSEISRVQLFDLKLGKVLISNGLEVSSVTNATPILSEELLTLNPANEKFDQVQVFYFSQQALRWIDNKLKIKLSSDVDIQVHAGAPEKTNIFFYYDHRVRLGSGDDELYARIPQDPSIVEHETFHAVIDQMCRLPFQGEGGSINEGLADTLTVFHLGQPNLGEVAFLKGPFKRTVENKSKFIDRNGGLYHDSLILSGLMWELRNKIGQEKTLSLTYNLLLKLGPTSNFEDLRKMIHAEVKSVYSTKELEMATHILKERAWWSDEYH